ncbi:MAG TPA: hypothetical protein VG096_03705 [Bryobacteraceae bacterium]|nr:hypothetical protein [Bryobacteraceae bacterium]
MQPFVNTFFEKRLEQLFDLAQRVEAAFAAAGLDYRVVGGLATYLYVEEAEPDAGRLTKDIDIAVRREDLPAISKAVQNCWTRISPCSASRHVGPNRATVGAARGAPGFHRRESVTGISRGDSRYGT